MSDTSINYEARLAAIIRLPIAGNAWQDAHLFEALDKLILDESAPTEIRKRAISHIDVIMGEDVKPITDEALKEYVDFAKGE